MRLIDCFVELIAYVAYFLKTVDSRQPSFDVIRAEIERLFSKSRDEFQQNDYSDEDYDLARFAVIAWVDEAILGSSWEGRDRWQREPLQRAFYQTTDAGEIFFDRLNNLGLHQRDVREIYYLCLAMGFAGRFCHEGDEYLLEQLKISNLKVLTGSSLGLPSIEKEELFPEAYPAGQADIVSHRMERWLSPFTLFCLLFPPGLFACLFVIYRFILNHIGNNLLNTVP